MEVFLSWFIYLLLAALGLLVAHGLYSSLGWRGRLSSCGAQLCYPCGFPCCRADALGAQGLRGCGCRASLSWSIWVLPGPGIEPAAPALVGGLFTTGLPGKSGTILKAAFGRIEPYLLKWSTFPQGLWKHGSSLRQWTDIYGRVEVIPYSPVSVLWIQTSAEENESDWNVLQGRDSFLLQNQSIHPFSHPQQSLASGSLYPPPTLNTQLDGIPAPWAG